jgi:hypothetical protein
LLGVSAPLTLGLISGMFAFVPYVGPIPASVSGVLMAAMQGPILAGYVIALYAGIHCNLITPLVQAEAVELPPVLTLFATLVFGLLLGPVGVLLAAPHAVVLLVAINMLYIEGVLGKRRVWPSAYAAPSKSSADKAAGEHTDEAGRFDPSQLRSPSKRADCSSNKALARWLRIIAATPKCSSRGLSAQPEGTGPFLSLREWPLFYSASSRCSFRHSSHWE